MHYAIGKSIAKERFLSNDFILGSLAPDVNKNSGTAKELTHFMIKRKDGEHDVFPDQFIKKYANYKNDDFVKGYYAHLISDEIWLKNVYGKYIVGLSPSEKKKALQAFYEDFRNYNGILVEKFNLQPFNFRNQQNYVVDEINSEDLPSLISDLNADFIKPPKSSPSLLQENDIYGYINDSINSFLNIMDSYTKFGF